MPYKPSWEPLGVVCRFSGVVSDEELIAATEEVTASPLFPAMKYLIVDFSMIEKLDVSSAAAGGKCAPTAAGWAHGASFAADSRKSPSWYRRAGYSR